MLSSLSVKAPAKINLFLNIQGQRPDDFHDVRLVMQTLELADILEIHMIKEGGGLHVQCASSEINLKDNSLIQAYQLFYQRVAVPPHVFQVRLAKKTPVQAGLGGGSSDAAAMLKALNEMHHFPASEEELYAMATELGSDVPFFLYGGTCVATGRGEVITPCAPIPAMEVALIKPKSLKISTPEAYALAKAEHPYQTADFSAWEMFLQSPNADLAQFSSLLFNDFESILFPHYPELAKTKQQLLNIGIKGVLLSGTGPTVYGLLDNPDAQWREIQASFPFHQWSIYRTRFWHPLPVNP